MFSSFFSSTPNLSTKGLKSNDDLIISETNSSLPRFSSILSSPLLPDDLAFHLIEPDAKSANQVTPSSTQTSSASLSSSSLSFSSPTSSSSQSTQSLLSSSLSLSSPPLQPSITQSSGSISSSKSCSTPSSKSSNTISSSLVSDFTKFAEKKRNQAEKQRKTLRSVLRNTAQRFGLRERITSTSSSSSLSPSTPTTRSKGKNFLRLESFPSLYGDIYTSLGSVVPYWGCNSSASTETAIIEDGPLEDIQRQVNVIAYQLNEMKTADQMSTAVAMFYQSMINRFEEHPIFKEIVQVSVDQLIDYTEIRLLSSMCNTIFNQILIEDERKDLQLQNQIRSLNWITTDHLELDLDLTTPEICNYMDQAIGHIIEMGSKGIPLQKLECIVNCSKALLQMLSLSREGEPVSADLFLPSLVYTVIQANPPLLHSNIKLINQFSSPSRLSSGETSYYFTNLCCAVAFIEKLDGESLNLSEEKFRRYINGDERPNNGYNDQLSIQFNSRLNEAFHRMNNNNNLIASLSSKQSDLEEEINQLKHTIMAQQESLLSQLRSATESLSSSVINDKSHQLRKEVFKLRSTQSPFYYELNQTNS